MSCAKCRANIRSYLDVLPTADGVKTRLSTYERRGEGRPLCRRRRSVDGIYRRSVRSSVTWAVDGHVCWRPASATRRRPWLLRSCGADGGGRSGPSAPVRPDEGPARSCGSDGRASSLVVRGVLRRSRFFQHDAARRRPRTRPRGSRSTSSATHQPRFWSKARRRRTFLHTVTRRPAIRGLG